MNRKIFLAGASGVIGRRLGPLLVEADYEVFGTTRSEAKAAELEAAGVKPIVVDVFDGPTLSLVMTTVQPDIVMHQLTDLTLGLEPTQMAEAIGRNARIRIEGTKNLVAAVLVAGTGRIIAQSIAWAYAPGARPYSESDDLDLDAEGTRAISVRGVATLERLITTSQPLEGAVLRYRQLYGPGTGSDQASGAAPLHVDAAAHAALLAVERGTTGIFDIAEDNGFVSIEKARRELGWDPGFRIATKKQQKMS
jgi:nucleoside-diphosphate-sugar epimerase